MQVANFSNMPVSLEDTTKTFLVAWLKAPFLWDVNQHHWVENYGNVFTSKD
jgi:hypothetical protein